MTATCFSEGTLDDLLRSVIENVLANGDPINPSKGPAIELAGVLLELKNPLARLSRTETRGRVFSSLGELCWYLAGSDDLAFIKHYIRDYEEESDDGKVIHGAYGPRLFSWKNGINQFANITRMLIQKPDSRQTVIQLFDALDIEETHRNVPCTCTLQFMRRRNKLHLFTNMRSNDIHKGLPHDVFCFTMLLEILARETSTEVGTYKHAVGSLHLYDQDIDAARRFLEEGWQPTIDVAMPEMPKEDPTPSIRSLVEAEAQIRTTGALRSKPNGIQPYWADLIRLLQVFSYKKLKDRQMIQQLRSEMIYDVYLPFIEKIVADLEPR
jgi:thymidylate synthase